MLKKSEISYSDFSIMSTYMQSNQANNFGFSTEMDNNEPANFPTNRIFMGNLASELEEFTIYRYCSAYGEITKCQIMKEPKTDRSRGFGFITYAQATSAQAILNARPHYIGHHKINVKPAFPTSETLIQGNAAKSTSNLPKTRRLFVAYNTEEAKLNNLVESAIFGFLSSYGVVKEIVQQFSSTSSNNTKEKEEKKNTTNNYWIVEFLDEATVDRCMSKGAIQYFSDVRLYLKRVISQQELLRRKRKLEEDTKNSGEPAERRFPFMPSLTR